MYLNTLRLLDYLSTDALCAPLLVNRKTLSATGLSKPMTARYCNLSRLFPVLSNGRGSTASLHVCISTTFLLYLSSRFYSVFNVQYILTALPVRFSFAALHLPRVQPSVI